MRVYAGCVAVRTKPKKPAKQFSRFSKPLNSDRTHKKSDPDVLKIRAKKATKKSGVGGRTQRPITTNRAKSRLKPEASKACSGKQPSPAAFPYKLRRRRSLTSTKPSQLYCPSGSVQAASSENERITDKALGRDANHDTVHRRRRESSSAKAATLTSGDSPRQGMELKNRISNRLSVLRSLPTPSKVTESADAQLSGNSDGKGGGGRGERPAKSSRATGNVDRKGGPRTKKLSKGATNGGTKEGEGSLEQLKDRGVLLPAKQRRNLIPTAADRKPRARKPEAKGTVFRHLNELKGTRGPLGPRSVQTRSLRKRSAAERDGGEPVSKEAKKLRIEGSLVCSAVSPKMAREAQNATRTLKGMSFCTDGYEDGRVSHVVMGDNKRTLKVLLGIANGAHFLDPSWLSESVAKGEWQDASRFKRDGKFAEAAERARRVLEDPNGKKPLAGRTVAVQTGAKRSSLVPLRRVAVALGARIVATRAANTIVIAKGVQNPGRVPAAADVVSEDWLISVAENYALPEAEDWKRAEAGGE